MRFLVQENKLIAVQHRHENTLPLGKIASIPQPPVNPTFSFDPELQMLLTGKQLLLDDLPFPLEAIQTHYENGYVTYRKGIETINNKPVCIRCGNKDSSWFATFPCSRCGENCFYCRKCLMMGRISACTPLVGWNGPPPAGEGPEQANPSKNPGQSAMQQEPTRLVPVSSQTTGLAPEPVDTTMPQLPSLSVNQVPGSTFLHWTGKLSEGQQSASDCVSQAIHRNQELLVWAVCGAGKTEVLFQGIDAALQSGKRVCIATPRTDVVLELTPRLKAAFPSITVASLYGGSEDRHLYAPLTIATTHQLLRFYQAFDTIILDEVDAFPFTADESLQYAAVQARKPVSSIIFLTATPSTKWQQECVEGKRLYTIIPARFHRHPLPVPEFSWCGNWQKLLIRNKLPPKFLDWVRVRLQNNKQALLFFPHIPLMEKALPILRHLEPKIEAVHAEDPDRKEKVQQMRRKELSLLLTTTILERGVTFPNIDVAVVGSEDDIFTESALVQIAGRAGRSAEYPNGTVTFFHYGKTEAMLRARKQIVTMNQEGVRKGLIDI